MGEDEAPAVDVMDRYNATRRGEFEEIITGVSPLAVFCSVLCCPLVVIGSCYTIEPKEEAIVIHFGTVTDVITTEGCHYNTFIGRTIRKISTTQQVIDLQTLKITDSHGAPVMVSCVMNYRFSDPKKALLNVNYPAYYIECQASAVVKQIVGKFSYEELKTSNSSFSDECVKMLQPLVETAGCTIQSVTLNELVYAPEIADAMLKKQQAIALLDARSLLVDGAVDIATKCIEGLKEEGIPVSPEDQSKLVTDLITVFVGSTDTD